VTRHRGKSALGGGSISIGGNVAGSAIVAGSGNHVAVTTHGVPEAVLTQLQAMRAALDGLTGSGGEAARREADAALAAAARPSPDKHLVGAALGRALEAARTTEEFAEGAVKLAPLLHGVVGWLGDSWSHLIGSLV